MIPYLIVVHPGSACGSANFNIGKSDARAARDYLAASIRKWEGHFIVLNGAFCDELQFYPDLEQAIDDAVGRARIQGFVALKRIAEDPDQVDVIKQLVEKLSPLKETPLLVTDAWASRGDEGCVNSVVQALNGIGYVKAAIADSAVFIDDIDDDFNEDDEFEANPAGVV